MIHSPLLQSVAGIRHQFQERDASPPQHLLRLKQIHSTQVFALDSPVSEQEGDGILTHGQLPAGVQTADCLPVLFAASDGSAVAAVHAGWRGLKGGILIETLHAFRKTGIEPRDLVIAIGPSIKECCFEVGPEVLKEFESPVSTPEQPPTRFGKPEKQPRPKSQEGAWLDLTTFARRQLSHHGVPIERIDAVPICTYCCGEEWASFRRATHKNQPQQAGRQWSWIQRAS